MWTCSSDDKTAVSFNASVMKDASVACTALSTVNVCDFMIPDVLGVQATLSSENCDPSWVAPLWINIKNAQNPTRECPWWPNQFQSGEIDIFERGCLQGTGYLLSMGSNPNEIVPDAWQQEGRPGSFTPFTGVLIFDHQADRINSWKCPASDEAYVKQSDDELRANGCTLTKSFEGKLRGASENYGKCNYHFVTDFWGAGTNCAQHLTPRDSACTFDIKNIKMSFQEGKTPAQWTDPNATCHALLS